MFDQDLFGFGACFLAGFFGQVSDRFRDHACVVGADLACVQRKLHEREGGVEIVGQLHRRPRVFGTHPQQRRQQGGRTGRSGCAAEVLPVRLADHLKLERVELGLDRFETDQEVDQFLAGSRPEQCTGLLSEAGTYPLHQHREPVPARVRRGRIHTRTLAATTDKTRSRKPNKTRASAIRQGHRFGSGAPLANRAVQGCPRPKTARLAMPAAHRPPPHRQARVP
nr:hypothetical protein [Actinopolymorpha alba]